MKFKVMLLAFFILIGSDLLIGFFGHYSGTTNGAFTLDAFMNYLATVSVMDLLPIVVIAAVVCYLIYRLV